MLIVSMVALVINATNTYSYLLAKRALIVYNTGRFIVHNTSHLFWGLYTVTIIFLKNKTRKNSQGNSIMLLPNSIRIAARKDFWPSDVKF